MDDARKIITLSFMAALGAAIVFNAGAVTPLVKSVADNWRGMITDISGARRGV